jgi:FkbM family methyltransferase
MAARVMMAKAHARHNTQNAKGRLSPGAHAASPLYHEHLLALTPLPLIMLHHHYLIAKALPLIHNSCHFYRMVSIRKAKHGFQVRQRGGRQQQYDKEKIGLMAGGLCIGVLVVIMWNSVMGANSSIGLPPGLRNLKPHPHLKMMNAPMSDSFNAIALDILETLQCAQLLNVTASQNGEWRRRRLGESSPDGEHGDDGGFKDDTPNEEQRGGGAAAADWNKDAGFENNEFENVEGAVDDYMDGGGGGNGYFDINAKHLFCIAASESPPSELTTNLRCDAAGGKRQGILDLWSAARSQMPDKLFLQVLGLAKEQPDQSLLDRSYNLWAPTADQGLTYMLATLNDVESMEHKLLHGLQENLGPSKLFVDVGSGQGLTTLAVANLYPGTRIVSMEPASPNWLMQELNLKCNLEHDQLKMIHVVLAGVGPNTEDEENMMAKLMWRPTATTSTRSWTPAEEQTPNDVELLVRLRRLNSILAEANVYNVPMDVLNVDCEGCEYNLIPALSEEEFESIPAVMGGLHWGYIPVKKLPSSERGSTTHSRLCTHENIARTAKECCAFPDLQVKSSVPGELLVQDHGGERFPPKSSTVLDVAGELCDEFDQWAKDHFLNDIDGDWGWFELTSQA